MTRSVVVMVGLAVGCCGDEPGATCVAVDIGSERERESAATCEVIKEYLRIEGQGWLESLELPLLQRVTGDLVLGELEALERVSLPALESASSLVIDSNPALTTLEGLASPSLGVLEIRSNDALESLAGLGSLLFVWGDLTISGNPMLCQDEAEAFAASIEVEGSVSVSDNGTGRTDCGA